MNGRYALLSVICSGLLGIIAFAQTTPPKTPLPDAETFQRTLTKLVQSGTSDDVGQALALLKARFAKDDKEAENQLKMLKNLRAKLMADGEHSQQMLEIIQLGKQAKRDKNNVGYLYGMEVIVRFRMGQPDEAMSALARGFAKDPLKNVADEVIKSWPLVFKADAPATPPGNAAAGGAPGAAGGATAAVAGAAAGDDPGKRAEFIRVLEAIAADCRDQDTVEMALRKRIDTLNALGRRDEALADARRLFNVATMPHTAQAIQILDKQIALVEPDKQTLFRREQSEGGQAVPGAEAGAAPGGVTGPAGATSTVVLAITPGEGEAYKKALAETAEPTSESQLHRAELLLLTNQAEAAAKLAGSVLAAREAATLALATDMVARCQKAQDGTIGRANAWLQSHPVPEAAANLPAGGAKNKPSVDLP